MDFGFFILFSLSLVLGILFQRIFFSPSKKHRKPVDGLVVLGSGGHTTEMVGLLSGLDVSVFKVLHVVVSHDDHLSPLQEELLQEKGFRTRIHRIRRSRSVGQSYVTSVWTTLLSTVDCVKVALKTRPKVVIVNGPGTCLPICLVCKVLSKSTVLFIESICRVTSLSLTGKLLYFIADHLLVQWPDLEKRYPRVKYVGLLV